MKEEYKALVEFFRSMKETAIDIYQGNTDDPEILKSNITEEEYESAFNSACLEFAYDSIIELWYTDLPARLADYYGRNIKSIYIKWMIENED